MRILVTGAAGFIGYHVCKRLLERGDKVVGVDCFLREPYGASLKQDRSDLLEKQPYFLSLPVAVEEMVPVISRRGVTSEFDAVIHLASRAGVRGSSECPADYVRRNILSFASLLEFCAKSGIENIVYASTSSAKSSHSVYGASKRACELLAEAWCRTHTKARVIGLRYFTVIGAWGRPDMAAVGFARKMLAGEPITVYGQGQLRRTFTCVDDVADVTVDALTAPLEEAWPLDAGTAVYEVGPRLKEPPTVMDLVEELERACGRKALIQLAPTPTEDVALTRVDEAAQWPFSLGSGRSWARLREGVAETVEWVKEYYAKELP